MQKSLGIAALAAPAPICISQMEHGATQGISPMNRAASHFGQHLTLDAYHADPTRLNDQALVYSCLSELPEKLGMHKLADPVVYAAPDNGARDPGGWSGIVVIAESHISVHTFPMRRFVSIDVYTCRSGLDTAFITSYFKNAFAYQEEELNLIVRGKKYPQHNIL